jgi:transcriptional regulator
MHPTSAFRWSDLEEMRGFVTEHAFATISAVIDGRLVAAQAPLIVDGKRFLLHLSRANPIAKALPVTALAIVSGPNAYVSPDWYDDADQVPTWNYESVEIAGTLAATDDDLLREILIRESVVFEGRIPNKRPWTIDKLQPETLAAKLKGIVGITLEPYGIRGTRKLSQNKSDADRAGVIEALSASPHAAERAVAARMR